MTRTLALTALLSTLIVGTAYAADPASKTVAELYKEKAALNGKEVILHGKVAKANNQIMDRNWIHLRDGTGDAADGSNDITITSQDVVEVGDEVTATGTVAVDLDFGSGYKYPLIVEKATLTKGK
jgi:hypothetical protein